MQEYYFKGTLKNGLASYDHVTNPFYYHEGENIHPNPEYDSNNACGRGFHLCKSIEAIRQYFDFQELYLASVTGKIIAEDNDKVRVDKVYLIKVPPEILKDYDEARATALKAYYEAIAPAERTLVGTTLEVVS